jgi:hypothetical protein
LELMFVDHALSDPDCTMTGTKAERELNHPLRNIPNEKCSPELI